MRAFVVVILLMSLLFFPKSICANSAKLWDGKILDLRTSEEISSQDLAMRLATADIIVLGETHYNSTLHKRQGDVIYRTVKDAGVTCNFTVAWEFLDIAAQERTRVAFRDLLVGSIDASTFMERAHGNKAAAAYAPIAEATKLLMGYFIGVNTPDEERHAVKKGGIAAANSVMIPPNFSLGDRAYFERFSEAMKHHIKPEQVPFYFVAQCLSDEVMAYHLLNETATPLKFLVVGGFHSDFAQGVVARLRARAPKKSVVTVRFLDLSETKEGEIPGLLRDTRYGLIADFVHFVNEPQSNNATDNNMKSAPAQ